MSILITGATGFIGHALSLHLESHNYSIRRTFRPHFSSKYESLIKSDSVAIDDINANTDWTAALSGINCVIHCAARAHVMNDTEFKVLNTYRSINVEGTRHLAEQAAANGVTRFIFLSSIKVNGERTSGALRFTRNDRAQPEDPYAVSKWEAEQVLHEISARTGLDLVIIRPPLVYGHGVKGNLARMVNLVRSGLPLPFGAINNQRSLIGIDNLLDLLQRCVEHPQAPGNTFLASDGEDLSTPELLARMAKAMHRSSCLFPMPLSILRIIAKAAGKASEIDRLVGSLRIDDSDTREILDWLPPISIDAGIYKMINFEKKDS